MPGSTEWLTYAEAAERIGTTVQAVRRLVLAGVIEARDRRISRSSVERYVAAGRPGLPGVFRRLIIQLPPELADRVQRVASERHVSMSEVIRQALSEVLP